MDVPKWEITPRMFFPPFFDLTNPCWVDHHFFMSTKRFLFLLFQGVPIVNASNNHFPCDCHVVSWMKSPMFANQSRERMMANNYCISPYEVHGKSIQSAKDEAHLFDDCPADDEIDSDSTVVNETALETTKPSTLFSSSDCRSNADQSMAVIILSLLFYHLGYY